MGPCFIVFERKFRGNRAKEDTSLLGFSVGGPGAHIISAEGASEALAHDGGLGEVG